MDFKTFWKESTAGFIVKNILLAIVAFVVLAWVTLIVIDFYTNHGESEEVPDLRGMMLTEADAVLAQQGIYPQVIDSVFSKKHPLGSIIEQVPTPGSTIKRNRPVYLIINSKQVRQIPLPNVTDVSFRQADAMLKAIGLNIGSVEYKDSEYKDLVVDVKYKGASVQPGTRIPEGSTIVLVVGSGFGSGFADVPYLKGMTLSEARDQLAAFSLTLGATEFDVPPTDNEEEYIIYRQRPGSGRSISVGSRIDVWLSKDRGMLNKDFSDDDAENDEIFF